MSKVAHTPGPWRVEKGTTLVWGDCNPDDHSTRGMGYPIAEARINPSGNWSTGPYADEGEANAHLIASAPELLGALKGMVAWYATRAIENDEPLSPEYQDAEIAEAMRVIARAEGRQP